MIHLILILSLSPIAYADETTIIPNLTADETTIIPNLTTDPEAYVNCGQVERLLQLNIDENNVAKILNTCWRRGVTLDELADGIVALPDDREDIENYDFSQLYVSCEDVFAAKLTRLTTSLVDDYVGCVARGAINENLRAEIDERFADILQVHSDGNSSVTVDEGTLVSCANASQRISLLCREYGLTGDQWSRGFLRYHHGDKWAVEEELAELSLGCDRVFNARLHEDVYDNFPEAFLKCQATLGVESEVRNGIEKTHAKELMQLRGGRGIDLRGYVSCRHLIPVNVGNAKFSASWYAYDQCRAKGLTYEQLCNGTTVRDEFEMWSSVDEDVENMYVECDSVFNEELWSFTTGLVKDYQICKEVGKIDQQSQMMVQKKFAKLFNLLATKRPQKKLETITEDLIPCSGLDNALANECRRRGTTLAQELRGIGSLAAILGDKWLNIEPLDKLYIKYENVFDKFIPHLDDVALEKFIQCRWNEGMSKDGLAYIDQRIADEYRNDVKTNGKVYKSHADVQISSTILFDDRYLRHIRKI